MTRSGAAIAAMLALLALPGCRAIGVGGLDRPGIGNPVLDETTQEVVAALNENARLVDSLQAKTVIKVSGGMHGTARGTLMMQRPRDFKLVLRSTVAGEIANIGSNTNGFWFWVENRNDPSIYTCKYDQDGKLPPGIPVTMQPDWIVEALGLREIPEDEAQSLKASRGDLPGTLVLRGKRPVGDGQFYLTETVVSAETKRILSHAILAPDRKTVLTRADLSEYASVGGEPVSGSSAPVLPGKIRLAWVREGLTLDVSVNLKDVKLNVAFPENQFAELELRNIPRRDLATMAAGSAAAGASSGSSIRESRPIPPLNRRRGIFLRDPVPIGEDGASIQPGDARPLDADLPPLPGAPANSLPSSLVDTPLPSPPADPSGSTVRVARRPAWVTMDQ